MPLRAGRPVERLLAEAIAGGEEAPFLLVPHGECELAVQASHRLIPEMPDHAQQDFRVRPGAKAEPAPLQILAQLPEVVDLPLSTTQ